MKVKICGLSRPADIKAVNQYQPDYAGFIMNFPKSHRNVSAEQVKALRANLSPQIPVVGVTVNQPMETVAQYLNNSTIDIAQLHGQEDETYIHTLKALTGKPVWKAFKIRSATDLEAAKRSPADLILLDNGYGTGETFDWTLVRDIGRPFILAGGLRVNNLRDAAKMQPYAMDISSGAETNRIKDPDKIRTLIEMIRSL
ncbi:MAG: phosphoribosylanthranilate isomerase [Clostridia bacterium]|nr:phosphoribosylanthranilate isomerase [Clostridia bacterium]